MERIRRLTLVGSLALGVPLVLNTALAQPDPEAPRPSGPVVDLAPEADVFSMTAAQELRSFLLSAAKVDGDEGPNRYNDWLTNASIANAIVSGVQRQAGRGPDAMDVGPWPDWINLEDQQGRSLPWPQASRLLRERARADGLMRDSGVYATLDRLCESGLPVIPTTDGRGRRDELRDTLFGSRMRALARAMEVRYLEAERRDDTNEMLNALRVIEGAAQAHARQPGLMNATGAGGVRSARLSMIRDSALGTRSAPAQLDELFGDPRRERLAALIGALEATSPPRIRFALSSDARLAAAIREPGSTPTPAERGLLNAAAGAMGAALASGTPDDVERVRAWVQDLRSDDTVFASPFLMLELTNLDIAPTVFRVEIARHRAVLAMLRVELYRAEHRQLPETLGEADGALIDPFDPAGGPLRYRVSDPFSLTPGEGYLLYSVGADGIDDGGAPGAGALSRTRPEGLDFVVNTSW